MLPLGESAFRYLYYRYSKEAKERNLSFDLSKEDFRKLTLSNCAYCGIKPMAYSKPSKYSRGGYTYNGIDRINSLLGYSINNCAPCCFICNNAKRNMSLQEFSDWVDRLKLYNR